MAEAAHRVERWRPVRGYEGRYEVSDHGRVRALYASNKHVPGRILRTEDRGGYRRVRLVDRDGGQRRAYVHALVLAAFVGPRPPKLEARHLDGNPANNHVGNLAWGTHGANMGDTVRHGTSMPGEKNPQARLTWEQVREIRARHEAGASERSIAAAFGIHHRTVGNIVRHQSWKEAQ